MGFFDFLNGNKLWNSTSSSQFLRLGDAGSSCFECSVDVSMDGHVVVTKTVDPEKLTIVVAFGCFSATAGAGKVLHAHILPLCTHALTILAGVSLDTGA